MLSTTDRITVTKKCLLLLRLHISEQLRHSLLKNTITLEILDLLFPLALSDTNECLNCSGYQQQQDLWTVITKLYSYYLESLLILKVGYTIRPETIADIVTRDSRQYDHKWYGLVIDEVDSPKKHTTRYRYYYQQTIKLDVSVDINDSMIERSCLYFQA